MRKLIQFLFTLLLASLAVPVWAEGSDELWEMQVTMDMGGMSMPTPSTNTCIPKGGSYRPDNEKKDKNCQVTDYKVSGNKVSWKMECTGKEAMSGSGEMTKTATTMKGVMKLKSRDMDMTQNINGKLVGTCDAAAQRRQIEATVADIKQRSAENTKQICEDSVTRDAESGGMGQGGAAMYHGKQLCTGYQPQLCKKARAYTGTYKGYHAYSNYRSSPTSKMQGWGWVLSECKIDLDKQHTILCKQAVTEKAYRFIGGQCPVEAKTLNDKYCADFGMSLSPDMTKPNAGMCLALRSKGKAGGEPGQTEDTGKGSDKAEAKSDDKKPDQAQDAAAAGNKAADSPAGKAMDSIKKLKGLFGF